MPGVEAVSLGGSRAQGTNRPESDWDLALYYRGSFDPQALRDIGWPGEVCEVGGWGGGVFNGGASLRIDRRRVDVHYRDLVVGELAVNRVLRGRLPKPDYPAALRRNAPRIWWGNAESVLTYARMNHAPHARLAQCAGLIAQAATQAAHAVLAARGQWVTNEKTLLTRAQLRDVDQIIAQARPDPGALAAAVEATHALCAQAVRQATLA